jgi:hypothetical protein
MKIDRGWFSEVGFREAKETVKIKATFAATVSATNSKRITK